MCGQVASDEWTEQRLGDQTSAKCNVIYRIVNLREQMLAFGAIKQMLEMLLWQFSVSNQYCPQEVSRNMSYRHNEWDSTENF